MNRFTIFSNENLGSVRVVVNADNDEPWFIAKDVCACLGVNNSRQALNRLDSDEKSDVILNDTRSKQGATQRRHVAVVNESGLYALIMSSRKKEARAFQKWVTQEVLPSIRKNGGYVLGQESLSPEDQKKLLSSVSQLTEDSNYWFEMYRKILTDYAEAFNNLAKRKPKEDSDGTPETAGMSDGVWVNSQLQVVSFGKASTYEVSDKEMR